MKHLHWLIGTAAALLLCLAPPAGAQTVEPREAVQSITNPSNIGPIPPALIGYSFRVNTHGFKVTHLGFYDAFQNGFFRNHDVGLWDAATGQLLASAVVGPSASLESPQSFFRYTGIAPVALQKDGVYVVAGNPDGDGITLDPPGVTFAPELTWLETRTTVVADGPDEFTGDLVMPRNSRSFFYGAGSLKFTTETSEASAVPEPGAAALFLPALGVVALLRRRKR